MYFEAPQVKGEAYIWFLCCPFEEKAHRNHFGVRLSIGLPVCQENLTLAITLPFLNVFSSNFQIILPVTILT